MTRFTCLARALPLFLLLGVTARLASGSSPTPDEVAQAMQWVATKFEGHAQAQTATGCVTEDKPGLIEKNTVSARHLRIVAEEYRSGLHFSSEGHAEVHLSGSGSTFEAVFGMDSNDLGYYSNAGRGSVVGSVEVNGKSKFQSHVMKEGVPGIPVKVDLGGATEFGLTLKDGGALKISGVSFNQADWADARVTLMDGTVVPLGDLPIGPLARPDTIDPFFSFTYGGLSSSELLKTWNITRNTRELDEYRTEHTLTYADPKGGLVVRCIGIAYHDFPTVEWTLYFKNSGSESTPIVENVQALDIRIERNGDGEFVLHHNKGAPATPSDYEPYQTVLEPNAEQQLSAFGGRPTNHELPYFNVEWPGQGAIIVVGWPGQWSARFRRDQKNGLQVQAGQELTHFKLLPGEEVRTPLIVLQFWKGDWIRAQNLWRKWMIAHNLPRPGGTLPPPQWAAVSSRQFVEMVGADEASQKMMIDRYIAEGLKPDYWWMDAGWYVNNNSWQNIGTWAVDTKRFPNGLRAVSDYAHSKGVRIIVWFEPERVTPGSWLYEHHPEWLLSAPTDPGNQLYRREWRLFNLGDPNARQWMTDHVDQLITEQGIDLYRQDFNMDPLNFWRASDAADRQGITENRYVEGYLAYWDALRRRHPNMLIDSCASGGRRNDLETLRRAVPLTRSDYLLESGEHVSQQHQTYGMAMWIPDFGTGLDGLNAYDFRSQMTPNLVTVWDLRRHDLDYLLLRRLIDEWRTVAGYFMGDYYPLTPDSLAKDAWMAWQFDRPELGEGMVQAFRRSASSAECSRFRLFGLDRDERYSVSDLDHPSSTVLTGRELMDQGLLISLTDRPSSAIVTYKRVPAAAKAIPQ